MKAISKVSLYLYRKQWNLKTTFFFRYFIFIHWLQKILCLMRSEKNVMLFATICLYVIVLSCIIIIS
jgi:hypothetical protein